MATFADFALLRAVSSYGGAEVLRARRVLGHGAGAPVHLALLGTDQALVSRVAAVAAGQAPHDQVARILEVGSYDGTGYAVADAVDGVELSAILEHDRRKKAQPDLAFSLAVAGQLAQLSLELNERGDVWASASAGLSSLFPAGLRLDGVVLRPDGVVAVRVLAGAVQDPARPTPFRAPELRSRSRKPAASSDVFVVTQVLRALLSCDASATSAPRLTGPAAQLGNLLAAGLSASPDERLGLFMLVERFVATLGQHAPRLKPAAVVAAALKRDYKALLPEPSPDPDLGTIATGLRARLGAVRASLEVAWPKDGEDGLPPTGEDARPTQVHPSFGAVVADVSVTDTPARIARDVTNDDVPSGVGRVFTDDDDPAQVTDSLRPSPFKRKRVVSSAPVLDAAVETVAEEMTTQTRQYLKGDAAKKDLTAESEPPWVASVDVVSETGAVRAPVDISGFDVSVEAPEATGAPPILPSEIEGGPTIQMPMRDDAEVNDDDDER